MGKSKWSHSVFLCHSYCKVLNGSSCCKQRGGNRKFLKGKEIFLLIVSNRSNSAHPEEGKNGLKNMRNGSFCFSCTLLRVGSLAQEASCFISMHSLVQCGHSVDGVGDPLVMITYLCQGRGSLRWLWSTGLNMQCQQGVATHGIFQGACEASSKPALQGGGDELLHWQ